MNAQTINHDKFRENIGRSGNWIRLIYMLIFGALLHLAGLVMWVLCALQFLFAALTGKDNENLRSLGGSIAAFVHQALDFVCYNSEKMPFPFTAWPQAASHDSDSAVTVASNSAAEHTDNGHDDGANGNQ